MTFLRAYIVLITSWFTTATCKSREVFILRSLDSHSIHWSPGGGNTFTGTERPIHRGCHSLDTVHNGSHDQCVPPYHD